MKRNEKKINLTETISKDLINNILKELILFEENEGYLKNTTSLQSLSKDINTNSNYLSKVVNHHKKKSFIHYINDLRIDYVIKRLKNDSVFRKYTINAIANEVGFKKAESFSKAFYKKAGIKPSFFMKEIIKIND